MKLAFVSDTHFGFSEDSAPQAREALRAALDRDVDAIILPGDLFDSRVPKQEVIHEGVRVFREIQQTGSSTVSITEKVADAEKKVVWKGVPLLAIPGTHERRSKGMTNIIQILAEAGLLINVHARQILLEKDGERVCVQGMQGVPEEYVRKTLQAASFTPEKNAFNLLVFHQSLRELLPFEKEDFISLQELPGGFDLYLNGHIHWNVDQEKNGRRLIVPGSTVITQMRKREEQPKGFYVFDTRTREARFHEINSRPFHFIEISFENASPHAVIDALDTRLKPLAETHSGRKPSVRCILKGSLDKGFVSSAVDVEPLEAKYGSQLQLYIEKRFESKELKEKIGLLRKLREEKKGARELGMEWLRLRLKENGVEMEDAEAVFDLLAEGDLDEAEKRI
ncbi:metallophosphoesterase family protein [Candidatus Micrarchaeota archaeon]|nr:metallophosphoesterase family protein [Candidatus Micrarchaeota archaeon]